MPMPTTVSAMPTATRGDVRSRRATQANAAANTGAAATIATTLGTSVWVMAEMNVSWLIAPSTPITSSGQVSARNDAHDADAWRMAMVP